MDVHPVTKVKLCSIVQDTLARSATSATLYCYNHTNKCPPSEYCPHSEHTHRTCSIPLAQARASCSTSPLCSVALGITEHLQPISLHLGIFEAEHDASDSSRSIRACHQPQVYLGCVINSHHPHAFAPAKGTRRPVEIPQKACELLTVCLAARLECPESWNTCWLGCKRVNAQLPAHTATLTYLPPTFQYCRLFCS